MGRNITDFSDIRPGDHVTIVLHSDLFQRTSTVDSDGFYVGRGAVAKGRAHIAWVRRYGEN